MNATPPVQRFLGQIDAALGPYGLLGLTPGMHEQHIVDEALRRRLDRLDQHPQGRSAEADEVRLALHVAAAQLNDPDVRQALLRRARATTPTTPAQRQSPPLPPPPSRQARPAPPTTTSTPAPEDLRDLIMAVLAHSGGWNEQAKRRLGGLAHAYGLDMPHLEQVLRVVSQRPAAPAVTPTPTADVDSEEEPVRAPVSPLTIASVALLACVCIMGAMLIGIVVSRVGDDQGDTTAQNSTAQASERVAASALPAQPVPAATTSTDGRELLEELRQMTPRVGEIPRDPLASSFEAWWDQTGALWPSFPQSVVTALAAEIAVLLQRATEDDPPLASRLLQTMTRSVSDFTDGVAPTSQDAITRLTWSGATLARINRDDRSDRSGVEVRRILGSLDRSGPRTTDFNAGAKLAMDALMVRMASHLERATAESGLPDGWQQWSDVAGAIAALDPGLVERAALDGLQRLLISAPDPALHRPTHEAIGMLVGRLPLDDPDAISRERLLAWFDDARVPTGALSVLTSRIVHEGRLPGAGTEFVLSADASESDRMETRDAYAVQLGLPTRLTLANAANRWLQLVSSELTNTPSGPMDALDRAVRRSMLSEVAARRWSGDEAGAADVLRRAAEFSSDADDESRIPAFDIRRLTAPSDEPDGIWARRYLAVLRNADARTVLLNELRNTGGPKGPTDADILAQAACYGAPIPLRKTAQRVLLAFADDPFVLNGVLEALPNAASQDDVSTMLELLTGQSLPSVRDVTWRREARRAVVERLLAAIASRNDRAVDTRADALRESYGNRLLAADAVHAGASVSATTDIELSALARNITNLRVDAARRYAEGNWTFMPLEDVERRGHARIGLADGIVQRFAAQQLTLLEATAYLVAAERPSRSMEIEAVLNETIDQRRRGRHIFEQIAVVEGGLLQLWVIREGNALAQGNSS
ncbi:MAG: hypothetical protein AAFX05_02030 [Planctomycetota bacterium]